MLALPTVVAFDLGMPAQVLGGAVDDDGRAALPRACLRPSTAAGAHVGGLRGAAGARRVDPAHGRHGGRSRASSAGAPVGARPAGGRSRRGARRPLGRPLMSICTGAFVLAAAGRARRAPGHHALVHADGVPAALPGRASSTPTCSSSTTATCSPRPASPRASTCACTSCAATTARGRQPRGPPLRRAAVARRRAVAVHRAPLPAIVGDGDRRDPRVGARPAGRAARPGRSRRARRDERADVHPPLPRRDRGEPRALAAPTSASSWPGGCWRAPTCRSTRSPSGPASAPPTSLRQHLHAAIGVAPLIYRRTYRGVATR